MLLTSSMRNKYEFSNKRIKCPDCGARRGLAPFKGFESLPYGYCHSCGKYRPLPNDGYEKPKFRLETIFNSHKTKNISPLQKAKPEPFIAEINVMKSQVELNKDNFCSGLINLGIPENHLINWGVGRGQNGKTLFFYRDKNNRYRNVKAIVYNKDLHRNKNVPPSFLFKKSHGYTIPLFGEHQLKENLKTSVILVESEKTAILGSYAMPNKIWLAVGGSNGLTKDKINVLKGFQVFVLFDSDKAGRQGAKKAVDLLIKKGIPAKQYDLFQNQNNGKDLADYLIEQLISLKHEINSLSEFERDLFEERAGILEFREGFSRYESELRALKEIKKRTFSNE